MKINLELALSYHSSGLSVLPAVRERKFPAVGGWKTYQERQPSDLEIKTWFANMHDAICLVCGKVSGNLEVLDFDHHGELFPVWKEKIAPELLDRLVIESTPSGGYHVAYRCEDPVCGNIKLAQGIRENQKIVTLIETRGEGGLFLCAPSAGYELIQNSFDKVPTISAEERENLLSVAYELNEHHGKTEVATVSIGDDPTFEIRPGDDYNSRGDVKSLLLAHGWTPLYTRDGNEYYRRPGKSDGGQSASFNGQVFYVFSSNAAPFEPGVGYSPFQVYVLLEHAGDYSAAAQTLLNLGYGKSKELPAVDLSGFLNQCPKTVADFKPEENLFPDPGPFPKELFDVPGFIHEYMTLSLETAFYPNKILALGGGLTFLSLLIGRVYKDKRGTHPNIYWISLADSGTGKEHARQVNKLLAIKAGISNLIGDNFASGEGLEDAMFLTKKKLFMIDEMDTLFNSMRQKDARAEAMMQRLLSFYSSVGTYFAMRAKAKKENEVQGGFIINPFLVLYGTALPKYFYGALEERVLENGLIPRTLIADAGERGKYGTPQDMVPAPELLEMIHILLKKASEGGNLVNENPIIRIMAETEEATAILMENRIYCDNMSDDFKRKGKMAAQVLWARANEKATKLAMLYAASENVFNPRITSNAAMWGCAVAVYLTKRMLFMADSYSYVDKFDSDCKRVLKVIRDEKGPCQHSRISRAVRLPADYLKRVLQTLQEREQVVALAQQNGGRPGIYYQIP